MLTKKAGRYDGMWVQVILMTQMNVVYVDHTIFKFRNLPKTQKYIKKRKRNNVKRRHQESIC